MKFLTHKIMITLLLISTASCSKSDDTPRINATNFNTSIDENPENNSSIGIITASGTGTLTYSITSQIPDGALSINSITGELKVANASLFDFETNPNINAVITILNTEATTTVNATINLNNIDDIAFFLSTSKTSYSNANNDDWVQITSSEYNALANNLNEVTKAGTTDTEYAPATAGSASDATRSNSTTTAIIPNNGFIFAFKYKVRTVEASITGSRVKQSSTANNTGFYDLGNALPTHSSSTANTDVFFVLKGNSTAVPATGYLAFYSTVSASLIRDTNNLGSYYEVGDAQTLSHRSRPFRSLHQSLVSTQKQWD